MPLSSQAKICTETSAPDSDDPLLYGLEHYFGYREFRPGQRQVIESALAGRDSLVLMPTGGGKSMCYQLPATLLPGLTIVVSPLIALMKDQVDSLVHQGIAAAYINSSQSQEEINRIFKLVGAGEIKLLYVAPERLLQYYFLTGLKSLAISLFAIDEAHCISQWGHDFRRAYTQLSQLKLHFPSVPIMALTATADVTTRKDILAQLNLHNPHIQLDSFDRPNIRYSLVTKYNGEQQVLDYIKQNDGESGIVYCASRWQVDKLADYLASKGVNCAAYHAGMDTGHRASIQDGFAKDSIQVVVATLAFGLGINKPDIRFVVHFQLPKTLEAYYQETGRAGRDGLPAEALMLFDDQEIDTVKKRIQQGEDEHRVTVELQRFSAMAGFAEAQICRRQVVLNYFAQYTEKTCGNCDICVDPPRQIDATVDAQKVLSTVFRVEQSHDLHHVIDVLMGKQTPAIEKASHHSLSTFGIGKEQARGFWFSVIRQLIHLGFLQQDIGRHSALCLTEAARPVLKGEQAVMIAKPRLQHSGQWRVSQQPSGFDRKLFAQLRALRKEIADCEEVAPFIVFNDASLTEMARRKPKSEREFLMISGVGDTKLARYGKPFIELIKRLA